MTTLFSVTVAKTLSPLDESPTFTLKATPTRTPSPSAAALAASVPIDSLVRTTLERTSSSNSSAMPSAAAASAVVGGPVIDAPRIPTTAAAVPLDRMTAPQVDDNVDWAAVSPSVQRTQENSTFLAASPGLSERNATSRGTVIVDPGVRDLIDKRIRPDGSDAATLYDLHGNVIGSVPRATAVMAHELPGSSYVAISSPILKDEGFVHRSELQRAGTRAGEWIYHRPTCEPVFPEGSPRPQDVRQGGLCSCYLLSAAMSIARQQPQALREMMVDDGETVSVRFFRVEIGADKRTKTYTPEWVTVRKSVAVGSTLQSDGALTLWPAMLEKAYASWLHTTRANTGSYSAIEIGNSDAVFEHLLGRDRVTLDTTADAAPAPHDCPPNEAAEYSAADRAYFRELQGLAAPERPATAMTHPMGCGPEIRVVGRDGRWREGTTGLIGEHVYEMAGTHADATSGRLYVLLRNPIVSGSSATLRAVELRHFQRCFVNASSVSPDRPSARVTPSWRDRSHSRPHITASLQAVSSTRSEEAVEAALATLGLRTPPATMQELRQTWIAALRDTARSDQSRVCAVNSAYAILRQSLTATRRA